MRHPPAPGTGRGKAAGIAPPLWSPFPCIHHPPTFPSASGKGSWVGRGRPHSNALAPPHPAPPCPPPCPQHRPQAGLPVRSRHLPERGTWHSAGPTPGSGKGPPCFSVPRDRTDDKRQLHRPRALSPESSASVPVTCYIPSAEGGLVSEGRMVLSLSLVLETLDDDVPSSHPTPALLPPLPSPSRPSVLLWPGCWLFLPPPLAAASAATSRLTGLFGHLLPILTTASPALRKPPP